MTTHRSLLAAARRHHDARHREYLSVELLTAASETERMPTLTERQREDTKPYPFRPSEQELEEYRRKQEGGV